MNDFLKNLRSSQKKEASPITRKNPASGYYPDNDRRMNRERRASYPNSMDSPVWQGRDIMPELLEHLASLSDQVERLVNSHETLVASQTQQHQAVTRFLTTLNSMLTSDKAQGDHPTRTSTSYTSKTYYTKDEVMSMIQEMRTNGATFSMIADHLKQKGIPTFSGRGEWHAQTIHRLCR
ncbi:MAG: hypothetical protein V2J08_10290 [Desulfotignum sp.]|jgi:hypothetical protein|nr:hypothetical protein [Desulfotignum sp.]